MPLPTPPLARAALLCVIACAFFASANALGKAAQSIVPGPDLHPLQVTAARFLFALIALLPFIAQRGLGTYRTAIPFRHLQRTLLGVAGVTCIFTAVHAMPLADATAIVWAAPLFTLVFAAWFLREHVGIVRWLAAGIGFAGVAVLMQPTGAAFEPAALIALAAALFTGAEVATIRILARRDATLTVLAINNTLGAVIALLAASFVFVTPSWPQAATLAGVGVVMVTGQAILLKSLAIAEASAMAPFYYATIVWSAVIGVVVFDEILTWRLFLGAVLIALGGIAVAFKRRPALHRADAAIDQKL